MRVKNFVIAAILALALFVPHVGYGQVIEGNVHNRNQGATVSSGTTTSTAYSATPVNITTSPANVYGLTVNAGENTSGSSVWVNFFNVAAASVTPGTTAALISVQLTGVTNPFGNVIPFGTLIPTYFSSAISVNCTATRNGTAGAKVPCSYNIQRKN